MLITNSFTSIYKIITLNNESSRPKSYVRRDLLRNLGIYKQRVLAAKKGYDLLKKKCDALKMKFRTILGKLIEVSR